MADYSTQIAALEAAAASGELEVRIDNERVIYRSMDDLLKALTYFQSKTTGAPTTGNPAPGVTLATFGNG